MYVHMQRQSDLYLYIYINSLLRIKSGLFNKITLRYNIPFDSFNKPQIMKSEEIFIQLQ
jgi:hypothetical protein